MLITHLVLFSFFTGASAAEAVADTRIGTQGNFALAATEGIVTKASTQGKFTRPATTEGFIKA